MEWAEVAEHRLLHGHETEADAILFNGLAAGFPLAYLYQSLLFRRLKHVATTRVDQPLTEALLLHACCSR